MGIAVLPVYGDSDIKNINEKILISKPVIKDENNFVTVSMQEGNSFLLEPDKPMLPIVTRVFILPFGSKIKSVNVNYNGENEIILSKDIKPDILSLQDEHRKLSYDKIPGI